MLKSVINFFIRRLNDVIIGFDERARISKEKKDKVRAKRREKPPEIQLLFDEINGELRWMELDMDHGVQSLYFETKSGIRVSASRYSTGQLRHFRIGDSSFANHKWGKAVWRKIWHRAEAENETRLKKALTK